MPTTEGRTFGIEIEMFHPSMPKEMVAQRLREDAGIDVIVGRYGGPPATAWVMKTDGSIHAQGYTMELVSPCGNAVLRYGDEALEVVRKIGESLTRMGCKVNRSCGFHVHFGAFDITVGEAKKIVERYAAFETIIDNIMPPSRRGENNRTYLNTLRTGAAQRIISSDATNLLRLAAHQGSRYFKVNLCAFQAHGTIEFRHHGGTVDPEKMTMWVRFLNSFIIRSQVLANNGSAPVTPPVAAGTTPRLAKTRRIAELIRQGLTAAEIAAQLGLRQGNVVYHSTVLIRDYGVLMNRTRTRDGNVRFTIIRWLGEGQATVNAAPAAEYSDNLFGGCDEIVVAFYHRRTAALMARAAA